VDRLFHIARRVDWEQALESGSYRVSTLGKRLDEVGFIHLCFAGQVQGVADAFYAQVSDLVLLELDPGRLISPLKIEAVADSGERFPHLYGEISPDVVIGTQPFTAGPHGPNPNDAIQEPT
jgi:glutathione S-transferase